MSGIIKTIGKVLGIVRPKQEVYTPPPLTSYGPSKDQIEAEQNKLQAEKKTEVEKAYQERQNQAKSGLSGTLLGGSLAPTSTLVKKKLLG